MKLILTNGYPYPYPTDLTEEQQEEISKKAGSLQTVIDGVVHFQWLHTVTVEFSDDLAHWEKAQELLTKGWKQWFGNTLEAPISAADGYGHPAIILGNVAYCGFTLVGDKS